MRIFLAATTSGMGKQERNQFIEIGKPKYMLETYFAGEKTCLKVLSDTTTENFLLDSGAFSYMSGAECTTKTIYEYAERYADFITQNKILHYFELDVDTIFGIDFVEKIRKMLEIKTNIQCIPVWHKSRGVAYWKRMVNEYPYVAIGGLVFHVKKTEWNFIKQLVDYAYRNGKKVHGLGFTKTNMLEDWNFYSVDSASWTKAAALGQQIHYFNGKQIITKQIDKKGKKVNLAKLVLHNGIEWCKYQRYMDKL